MTFLTLILAILAIPYYMYVSRLFGAEAAFVTAKGKVIWKKPARGIKVLLLTLPFAGLGYVLHGWSGLGLSFGFALLIATGHGMYLKFVASTFQDEYAPFNNYRPKFLSKEKLDFILVPFFGQDPRTQSRLYEDVLAYGTGELALRNFYGMLVTGLVPMIGLSITLVLAGHPEALGVPLICGGLKALAYLLGWFYYSDFKALVPRFLSGYIAAETEVAEVLRGFFLGLCFAILLVFIYV